MPYAEQLDKARNLVLYGTKLCKNVFLRFLLWVHADVRSKGTNVRKPAHTNAHTRSKGRKKSKRALMAQPWLMQTMHPWLSHG